MAELDDCSLPDLPGLVALCALAVGRGCEEARGVLAKAVGTLLAEPRDAPGVDVAVALAMAAPLTLHPAVGRELQRAVEAVSTVPPTTDALGLDRGAAWTAHMLHALTTLTRSRQAAHATRRHELALLGAVEAGTAPTRPGLLDGAAGVILVLLAAAIDDAPVWNQMLLLS